MLNYLDELALQKLGFPSALDDPKARRRPRPVKLPSKPAAQDSSAAVRQPADAQNQRA